MSEPAYVHVAYPWRAFFHADSREAAEFYAKLIGQTLRYGMPARRYGRLGGLVARLSFPERASAALLRRFPKHPRPDLDSLLAELLLRWSGLTLQSVRLPPFPPDLRALAVQRSAALTVFVFGERAHPLLVCKKPRRGSSPLELEARALEAAEGVDIAPKYLGTYAGWRVQEALDGYPLRVHPVTPGRARALMWSRHQSELGSALVRLAAATTKKACPQELASAEPILGQRLLSARSKALLSAAIGDLRRQQIAVLCHVDTSAQNCLVSDRGFVGLIDWEVARLAGMPGFDVLNAAVAFLDHGVGLVRWSEERAFEAFRVAWRESHFFEEARSAARDSAVAAGVPNNLLPQLEIAFFGRRLASRLRNPTRFATGPSTAARILEVVCES